MLSLTSTYLTFAVDGVTYVSSSVSMLREAGVPDAVILLGVRAHLRTEIDAAAERARAPWITPGYGQAMEYDKVEQQADAALKGGANSATPAKYPMLAATIGIDIDPQTGEVAADVLGVARSVQAARDAWIAKGAEIRTARLRTKAAIAEAATIEAAIEAAGTASWPPASGA